MGQILEVMCTRIKILLTGIINSPSDPTEEFLVVASNSKGAFHLVEPTGNNGLIFFGLIATRARNRHVPFKNRPFWPVSSSKWKTP